MDNVTGAEQSIPEEIKTQQASTYLRFTRFLWSKTPSIRFRYQQMYTLGHLNDIGVTVSLLKAALKQLKFYGGDNDESFDPALAASIVRFQYVNGLDPDGIAGTLTYAKLARQVQAG